MRVETEEERNQRGEATPAETEKTSHLSLCPPSSPKTQNYKKNYQKNRAGPYRGPGQGQRRPVPLIDPGNLPDGGQRAGPERAVQRGGAEDVPRSLANALHGDGGEAAAAVL